MKGIIVIILAATLLAVPFIVTQTITQEIVEPPAPAPSGGGGEPSIYSVKTNLFGIKKTYYTEYDGDLQRTIEGTSQDGNLTITIPSRTTALGEDGKRLKTLEVAINESPPAPPKDVNIIGLAYSFNPIGATFDPPIIFTWSYDQYALPKGVAEKDLVLAYYIDGEWIELECVVDTVNNTITASVKHFTTFAIMVTVPKPAPVIAPPAPPLAPTPTPEPEPVVEPAPVVEPVVPAPGPEPAPVEPVVPEAPPWGLIGGLIAVILIGLAIWLVKRQKSRRI